MLARMHLLHVHALLFFELLLEFAKHVVVLELLSLMLRLKSTERNDLRLLCDCSTDSSHKHMHAIFSFATRHECAIIIKSTIRTYDLHGLKRYESIIRINDNWWESNWCMLHWFEFIGFDWIWCDSSRYDLIQSPYICFYDLMWYYLVSIIFDSKSRQFDFIALDCMTPTTFQKPSHNILVSTTWYGMTC